MPTRPAGPCSADPTCPFRKPCPVHAHAYDRSRPSPTDRGYDGRWRSTRAAYLDAHPTCERGDCDRPATDVHHRDGLGPTGPLGHDWSNLQSLCHPHHSSETVRHHGGLGR